MSVVFNECAEHNITSLRYGLMSVISGKWFQGSSSRRPHPRPQQASTLTTLLKELFLYTCPLGRTPLLMGLPTAWTRFSKIPATILERFGPPDVCCRGMMTSAGGGDERGGEIGPIETSAAALGVRVRGAGRGERGGEYRWISIGCAGGMWIVYGAFPLRTSGSAMSSFDDIRLAWEPELSGITDVSGTSDREVVESGSSPNGSNLYVCGGGACVGTKEGGGTRIDADLRLPPAPDGPCDAVLVVVRPETALLRKPAALGEMETYCPLDSWCTLLPLWWWWWGVG